MKAILILSLLISFSTSWAGQLTQRVRITEINVSPHKTNFMRIHVNKPIVNPDGCGAGGFYVVESGNNLAFEQFSRVLFAAYLAKKEMTFWIKDCSQKRWGKTRPLIYDVNLK